jgi:GNAT superfamily N-acetyltransferase
LPERQHHTYEPWANPSERPQEARVPGDLWALMKQIDELGGEWSFNLFVPRTVNFHLAPAALDFYEPLGDFERVGLEALLLQRARRAGLPLAETGSVVVDYAAYPSIFNPVDDFLPLPSPGERTIGRHTASVRGIVDGDTLVVAHAWSDWTPDGTAKMTRTFFEENARGGQVSRPWNRGPLGSTVESLLETADPQEFQELWRAPRKRMSQTKVVPTEGRIRLSSFESWSLQSETPAEVLTLEINDRIRAGIAILTHDHEESSISDLFIWPPYRRRKLGTLLEQFAANRTIVYGNKRLVAYIWEADAVRGKERAIGFLGSVGYEIAESQGTEYVVRAVRGIS